MLDNLFLKTLIGLIVMGSVESTYSDDTVNSIISGSEILAQKSETEAADLIANLKKQRDSTTTPVDSKQVLKGIPLPHMGKNACGKDSSVSTRGKCASSLLQTQSSQSPSSHLKLNHIRVLIFASESVPANAIKELWQQAQHVDGKIVFRGLIGDSFKETKEYIQNLGIVADIDPNVFEEFKVVQVPTVVISKEGHHDKITGNITLMEALDQFRKRGDLRLEANERYKKIEGAQK